MKIALGADEDGFPLKEVICEHLAQKGHEIEDFGVSASSDPTPYYQIADQVARAVSEARFQRAILVCGTGMGMAIIANKHVGVYAAVCESAFTAEKSRSINNSNILTLGTMVSTDAIAKEIVDTWLNTEFTQGWDERNRKWLANSLQEIVELESQLF